MNILITNDDGIYSRGIYALAKKMEKLGKVFVVAPDKEQSAVGHAITIYRPLSCKKIKLYDLNIDAWKISGTPADCVKLGVETLLPERPDLIISGINDGENLGTDIIYSGTVSAAVEGSMFKIPSIAVSCERHSKEDFSLEAEIAYDIIEQVLNNANEKKLLININIPFIESADELKGIMIAELGVKKYKRNFDIRKDPRGNSYYWLSGELIEDDVNKDSDIYAIRNKYISITPLHVDLTDYEEIRKTQGWDISVRT